jgi:heme-degrading monooxygenase HmoA
MENADVYDSYLKKELFPRLQRELTEHGYKGFHVLRLNRGTEVEFVTMVWFTSLQAVQSFAGDNYESPVISEKAHTLLSRYADRCDHYQLTGFHWPTSLSIG